jgi:hypothetical protein
LLIITGVIGGNPGIFDIDNVGGVFGDPVGKFGQDELIAMGMSLYTSAIF